MKSDVGPRGVHGDAVDAVADLGVGVGDVWRTEAAVDRLPGLAAVVGAERAGGGDGDEDAVGIRAVEQDRVQAHAAGAGRAIAGPVPWPRRPASSCQVLPPSVERKMAASSTPA